MPTGATDSNSSSQENSQLSALDRQIQAHQKADNERSWIGYVASQVWRGDRTTLADLEKLAQETRQAEQQGDKAKLASMSREVQDKVQADKRALGIQDDISNYTSGALKMAGLFVGAGRFTSATKLGMIGMEGAGLTGWLGLAGSVGIHAADKAKVGDSGSELASNLALGALQGGVTKSLFNSIGSARLADPLQGKTLTEAGARAFNFELNGFTSLAARGLENPIGKGVLLGSAARASELTFNTETYKDAGGNASVGTGLKNIIAGTFDPKAMAVDSVLFGTANSATRLLTGGREVGHFANTVLTSTTLGLGSGAYAEYDKQMQSGQPLDGWEIARRAGLQGLSFAAGGGLAGGFNTALGHKSSLIETPKDNSRTPNGTPERAQATEPLSTRISEVADRVGAVLFPGAVLGMRPALAMASEAPGMRALSVRPTDALGVEPLKMSSQGDLFGDSTATRPATVSETATEAPAVTERRVEAPLPEVSEQVQAVRKYVTGAIEGMSANEPLALQEIGLRQLFKDFPEADSAVADTYVRNLHRDDIRRAIEGGFTVGEPQSVLNREPLMRNPRVAEAVANIYDWLYPEVATPQHAAPAKLGSNLRKYIEKTNADTGVDVRPVIEHIGRLSTNGNVAKAVDIALADANGRPTTQFADMFQQFGASRRSLPLTAEQHEAIKAFDNIATSDTMGTMGHAFVDAKARMEATPGLERAVGEAPDESLTAVAERRALEARSRLISERVQELESPDAKIRQRAIVDLQRSLLTPNAEEWFPKWEAAQKLSSVSTAEAMSTPEYSAVPPEVRRQIFASREPGTALEPYHHVMQVKTLGALYGESPEVMSRMLNLAGGDFGQIRDILDGTLKGGKVHYKDMVLEAIANPNTTTLEPLTGDRGFGRAILRDKLGGEGAKDDDLLNKLVKLAETDRAVDLKELGFKLDRRSNAPASSAARELLRSHLDAGGDVSAVNQLVKVLSNLIETKVEGFGKKPPPNPLDKEMNMGYERMINEMLVHPRITNISQLVEAAMPIRERSSNPTQAVAVAEAQLAKVIPADDPMHGRFAQYAEALIRRSKEGLPPREVPVVERVTAPKTDVASRTGTPVQADQTPAPARQAQPTRTASGEPDIVLEEPATVKSGDATRVGQAEIITEPTAEPAADLARQSAADAATATPIEAAPVDPIAEARQRAMSADATIRRQAVGELRNQLGHESAPQWFPEFEQQLRASSSVGMRHIMDSAEYQNVPADVRREMLSTRKNGKLEDTFDQITQIKRIGEIFKNDTDTAARLVQAGNGDLQAIRGILDTTMMGNKGAVNGKYVNYLKQQLQTLEPAPGALEPLTGERGLGRASLTDVLKDDPEFATKLISLADQNPSVNLVDMSFKFTNRASGNAVRELVKRHVDADGDPALLPKLVQALTDPFGAAKPQRGGRPGKPGRDEMDPLDKKMNFAYMDMLAELLPRAQTIQEVLDVTALLRNRGGSVDQRVEDAEAALSRVVDENDPAHGRLAQFAEAIIRRNKDGVPARQQAGDARRAPEPRKTDDAKKPDDAKRPDPPADKTATASPAAEESVLRQLDKEFGTETTPETSLRVREWLREEPQELDEAKSMVDKDLVVGFENEVGGSAGFATFPTEEAAQQFATKVAQRIGMEPDVETVGMRVEAAAGGDGTLFIPLVEVKLNDGTSAFGTVAVDGEGRPVTLAPLAGFEPAPEPQAKPAKTDRRPGGAAGTAGTPARNDAATDNGPPAEPVLDQAALEALEQKGWKVGRDKGDRRHRRDDD